MFLPWLPGATVRSATDAWVGQVVQQFGRTVVCVDDGQEMDDWLSTCSNWRGVCRCCHGGVHNSASPA
jgi:hypothetical protein